MNILFVCSGNTCRSPMAETLMEDAADRSSSLHGNVKVKSAGTFACQGAEATPEAIEVMEEMGFSLKRHDAAQFTKENAAWADLILCVAQEQIEHTEVIAPAETAKMHTLRGYVDGVYGDPGGPEYDILDPFDEGMDEYRACATQLSEAVSKLTTKLEEELSKQTG